jgi:processive 1,2-diacylglycerol beta-glucosyltransferase
VHARKLIKEGTSVAKTRIAVLSVSAGAGHVRAAEALVATAEAELGGRVEAVHIDVMDLVNRMFRKVYAESYVKVVARAPELWGYIYDHSDYGHKSSIVSKMHNAMERLSLRRLRQTLEALAPDHIICTHFLPAQLLSRLWANGRYKAKVWVVVTDFDIHGLWLTEHMQGYFAASEEVAWRMADRGLEPARVHVTGIPIMPVFRGS